MRIPEATEFSDTMSIAEFHDIGKIVNWFALGLQRRRADGRFDEKEPHDFEKCIDPEWGVDFTVPLWRAIFRKDDKVGDRNFKINEVRRQHFPDSLAGFIVSFADEIAAGMGRLREERFDGDPIYGYYCLWTGKAHGDSRLTERRQLEDLIHHLNGNPSWEETFRRYSHNLHSRAETAHPGLNVSTLYAHSVLTGKVARVLQPLASVLAPTMLFKLAEKTAGPQKLVPLLLEIEFLQQPFRTRDLSVFQARREAIAAAASRYPNNVLIRYANHLVALFLSPEDASGFVQFFEQQGFMVSETKAEKTLQYLLSPKNGVTETLDDALATDRFPVLPDSIEPPLCENCQMAHGQHRWPADFLTRRGDLSPSARTRISSMPWTLVHSTDFDESDRTRLAEWLEEWSEERLCSQCFEIRRTAVPLTRLAQWDAGKVAWVRIALDLGELEKALRQLHAAYIKTQARNQADKLDQSLLVREFPVRLPLMADFVEDYERAVGRWREQLGDSFGPENLEEIDEGLVCVKLTETLGAIRLLEIYHELLLEHFPKLLELDTAPLRLAISIAPARHLFFVNWRFLERSRTPVAVQLIGSGQAEIPLDHLEALARVVRQAGRHAFHRLRSIARTSKALAEVMLGDSHAGDRAMAELRGILPLGMDFESLMTLANLAET